MGTILVKNTTTGEYIPAQTRNVTDKKIIGYINLLGQKVDPKYTTGVIIEVYEDGTMVKKIK
jgi:hypothetical protein